LRRLDELRKSGVLTQQEYEERVALLKKELQALSSKERRRPLKERQENRYVIKIAGIIAAAFLVGVLIGYLFLGSMLPYSSSSIMNVSPTAGPKVAQCVEWPKSGSWAFYRLDTVFPLASVSGWIRIYSNGTHIFTAMLFGGNYALKTYSISEFSSRNFMNFTKINITKPVFIGEELVMTLKPMKAAVYQEATENYISKVYLDEKTGLPILMLYEAPSSSSLPVSASVSLAETNICQLQ